MAQMDENNNEMNLIIGEFEKTIAQVIQVGVWNLVSIATLLKRVWCRFPPPLPILWRGKNARLSLGCSAHYRVGSTDLRLFSFTKGLNRILTSSYQFLEITFFEKSCFLSCCISSDSRRNLIYSNSSFNNKWYFFNIVHFFHYMIVNKNHIILLTFF